ncbi:MAG: serine/threonine protein kinase [Methylococcaceae bacterium]|nr:MAG: serine/threonine protein kinase [Methylococcaceae bacterium]
MGDISANFNRSEFACHCGCGFDDVSMDLVYLLEETKTHFNSPIHITSGCRCEKQNNKVGGKQNSKHLAGEAADIQIANATPAAVATYFELRFPNSHGIGRYTTWTHIDVRDQKARWNGP